MNKDDLFMILPLSDPFLIVRTLWKPDLEITLGMSHPADEVAMAVCVPSNMWPRYKSDNDDDDDKSDDGEEYPWEGTDNGLMVYNTMLPPSTPEYDLEDYCPIDYFQWGQT